MADFEELTAIFAKIKNKKEIHQLLTELLTENELENLTLRWQLLKELKQGLSQREIAAKHKISLCKITRGSKILKDNNSICKKILEKKEL